MESFIVCFKVKVIKVCQVQSWIKVLECLEELVLVYVDLLFNFSFCELDKIFWLLLDFGEGCFGYGDKVVLEKVKL